MKIIGILTISIVCSFSLKGQYFIELTEKDRIQKNNIRQKVEWEHRVSNGDVSQNGTKASVTKYDEHGNVIEKIAYRFNGDISSKLNYKYDLKGNLIEYTRFDGRKSEFTIKQYVKYNINGFKIVEEGMNGTAGEYRNYFKYDKENNLKEIYYYSGSELTEKRVINYTPQKREVLVYKAGNVLTKKIVKELDSKGNEIREIYLGADGEEKMRFENKYDKNNNLIEEAKYYSGQLRNKVLNTYDSESKLVEVVYVKPDGTQYINNKYIYDASGKLVEERWYNENKNEFSRKKYKYNTRGNVVQADCYYAQFGSNYVYKYQYD